VLSESRPRTISYWCIIIQVQDELRDRAYLSVVLFSLSSRWKVNMYSRKTYDFAILRNRNWRKNGFTRSTQM
jgi:hypothetical protein